ncbi:hypothetical protein JOF56_007093 [Kibdelosporangium banguiense]|uniref:SPW repeat-containing protein n=1 Tax=Kibdelosporangium banguiense TaxID=1365924 RepID=A0ABS4TS11_9PSEU|nr:hypothetical protein [Kibdelosporangium banguiense]MBP2326708.1 hypothetical protein [Kibdelosporangium banguiense]
MKTRVLLGTAGLAMMAWGALLAFEVPQISEFGAWFVAGPIVHDLLLAPLVGAVGLVVKGPAKAGAVVSGVLVLIAIPLLWQENVPVNPGLHDRDYLAGLAISLGVVWLLVAAAMIGKRLRELPRFD